MFIRKLGSQTVNTKYGEKQKWIITDENSKTYDSWVSNYNKSWKEGDEIQIKDSQITSREYNGKTYWTIGAPPEAKRQWGGGFDATPIMDALRRIYEQNSLIIGKLNQMAKNSPEKSGVPPKADLIDKKEISADEIPF